MAHSVVSAKTGALSIGSVLSSVRNITIVYDEASAVYGASSTAGSKGRVAGNSDGKISFTFYPAAAADFDAMVPGATATLTAYTGGGAGSVYFAATSIIIDEVTVNCPIKEGGLITIDVTASQNSAITRGAAAISDSSTPNPLTAKGRKVNLGGSDRADATGWSLRLTSDNKAYNSTATAGVTKRVAGPIDASGSWTELEGDPSQLPAAGATGSGNVLKLYVTGTEFYQITWPIVESVDTPIQIEQGEIVEPTINWSFNGFSAGSKGSIVGPASGAIW